MKTNTHPTGKWLLATKNCAFLFGLILLISTSVFADEPNEQWVARYNGPGNSNDGAYDLAVRGDLCYVTGGSAGIGTSFDYATVLYTLDGKQVWAARYNGDANSEDCAYAIAVDSAAYVYVTGVSYGSGTGSDYATIKYSTSSTNPIWVRRYNGPENSWPGDQAYDIAVDNAGGVCVTGQSVGSGTGPDYATVKYRSSDGNELWVRRYNGPGNGGDGAFAVATDSSRNIYVTGISYGSGSSYDYATIKYDSNGDEKWVRRYNGPGNSYDGANALAVDSSGNVYVTGFSTGSGTYYDYATIKYDTNGNQLWAARYNGPANSSDEARALALDASGNVYVTGESDGDYATVKYSPDGNQLWAARYNGPANARDRAYALAVDNSGNVYVTGYSADNDTGWSNEYATIKYGANGNQIWVQRYSQPGDGNDGAEALALDMYGNVYVTGQSLASGTEDNFDYATIKYEEQPACIYVDASATGANNGSSWANAYKYLQNALTTVVPYSGVSIWVAQGTYRPDESTSYPSGTNDRNASFSLVSGVAIYGGFPSGGGNCESRKPGVYQTILSGDIGVADNNSDNSYHIVNSNGNDSGAILDGFTITAANNDYIEDPYFGSGGGMYNLGGSPTVTNCTFIGNFAIWLGGGMSNEQSSPTVTNCTFIGNSTDYYGGGIYNYELSSTLINCIFTGNSAGEFGGGVFNDAGSPILTNCTFSGNSALYDGGGMFNIGSPTLANCIFWGNTTQIYNEGSLTVRYCDVQGGWSGTGNINSNPLFVDADGPDNIVGTEDDNLRLSAGSPCIDAADNNVVPEEIETDLDGRSRFFDDPAKSDTGNGTAPIVDMGPYEYRLVRYVDANATGANNGSSWANAYKYLKDAIWSMGQGCEIWVAQGTYRPDEDTNNPSGTNDRDATFHLINSISIYGGFPSGGGNWASRDPNTYRTILSGDLAENDEPDFVNIGENSYHVVTGSETDSSAILDGFTVTAGNGGGAGLFNWSNGSPTIKNCTFSGNSANSGVGAGMYNRLNSNPTVINCTFIGNKVLAFGGGMYNISSNPTLTNCAFIGNSSMNYGGGMSNAISNPTITNCIFRGNSATSLGGGIFNEYDNNLKLINCTFSENSAQSGGGLYVNDSVKLTGDCNVSGNTASFGGGITVSNSGVVNLDADASIFTGDEFYISLNSRIRGTGSIIVGLGGEMIIDSNAVVDLNDPCYPGATGTIQCNGLLKVKGNGQLKHATVNVSRQAGGYFGKFQVEDSATAIDLDIYTDGDRFMDVDPCTFTGTIANNRIYVTITEGLNGSNEGILEVRGLNLPSPPCDFNDPDVLACQIDDDNMPSFDTTSWTLERLELAAGAKVTLVDRFSSGNDYPEVLYVKDLVLGADCNLKVGFEHLYYTNLSGEPNSIIKGALMGFSLDNIDCDSNEEFNSRVASNNFIHPTDPNFNRIQVERVIGLEPDPNGMMKMSNLQGEDGNMISARAKGEFAPVSEDTIRIRLNYLFTTTDPCAQIVVYLSDVPELLDHNNPNRSDHYFEVARIPAPPAPRPGSAGSGRFGDFEIYTSTGLLDLTNGTWIELELIEPGQSLLLANGGVGEMKYQATNGDTGDTHVYVDNWESGVYCYHGICLDLDWDGEVEVSDFLIVVSGNGRGDPCCTDGCFSKDGYDDSYDSDSWDWTINPDGRKNMCGKLPLGSSGETGLEAASSFGRFGASFNLLDLSGLNDLLICGKGGATDPQMKLIDRLYVFNGNGDYLESLETGSDRYNIRIVRGEGNNLYQINSENGVLQLDGTPIVPPGQTTCDTNEPRYNLHATVYVGIQKRWTYGEPNYFGRPVFDAAFDASFVYVVPVVVEPVGNESGAYAAAAKLQLDPTPPYYHVVKLYDGLLLDGDNQRQYRNTLREIELDAEGNVYVTNAHAFNASDILWKFEPGGAVVHRLDLDLSNPVVRAPACMFVSNTTNVLYLTSSLYNNADPNSKVIYGFSTEDFNLVRTITVSGMQHVTGITEDPVSGALWITGFSMNCVPPAYPSPLDSPFYDPYLAKVPFGEDDACAVRISDADDLAMPLSIVWTGFRPAQEKCGGADLNGNGNVNLSDFAKLAQYWLNTNCVAPSHCEGADLEPQVLPDGDVDLNDLYVLVDHWLDTGCLGP